MKTTFTILLGLSMSVLALGQSPNSGMSVDKAVAIKKIIAKMAQGQELSAAEAETYKNFREEGKKSAGGPGMKSGPGMQGAPSMQGGQGMMPGQGMQGGPSAEHLQQIFANADKDGDGKLNEEEFKAACEALRPKN